MVSYPAYYLVEKTFEMCIRYYVHTLSQMHNISFLRLC